MPLAGARRAAGLSQKDLANRLGVQLWTVDRMERGDETPEGDPSSGGSLLRAARHEAGLTQGELARRLNLPLYRLDRFERDVETPEAADRAAVATATGVDPSLLGRQNDVPDERPDVGGAAEAREAPRDGHWVRNTVLASIATLVTIRFFAEDLGVLPRSMKLVDMPILLVLLLVAALLPRRSESSGPTSRYHLPAVLFLAVCIVSVVVNSGRIAPAPALLFIYGFLAPIGIFHVVRALWKTGQALAFSRLMVALACVQFVIVLFIDLPEYVATHDPDLVSGTFGENAYQLVFFLLMSAALVAGIATVERQRLVARLAPFFFVATIATILLAQYRALLLTTGLTVLLVAGLLGLVRMRGAFAGLLVLVAFAVTVSVIPSVFPQLKLDKTISTITGDPGSYASKRLEVGSDVVSLYTEKPSAIAIGSGPGTYSSRAWETFAESPSKSTSSLGVKLPFSSEDGYRTDVSEKYTIPRLQQQEAIEGSFALTQPLSSYYALLAEVGLLGFVLLVAMYGRALADSVRMTLASLRRAKPGDPVPGLLLASTAGFFVILQMAILENWLEVTRLTFILWTLFAVATKEFEAQTAEPPTAKEAIA